MAETHGDIFTGGTWSGRKRYRLAFLLASAVMLAGCAVRHARLPDYGIPTCRVGVDRDFLSVDALQCWLEAPHGRWRIVSHHSLHDVLVLMVEASSLQDASGICRRIAAAHSTTFHEILVYTHQEAQPSTSRIVRAQWSPTSGINLLTF